MLSFAIQVIHMKIYWPLILESTIHLWELHSFKIPMLLHIVWLHPCDSHLFGEADIPIYQSSILSTKELHTSCKQFCAHFKLVRVLWVIKRFSTICSNYQDDHPSIWSKQLIEHSSNTSWAVFFLEIVTRLILKLSSHCWLSNVFTTICSFTHINHLLTQHANKKEMEVFGRLLKRWHIIWCICEAL